jgi:uncharacterized heparinase superfamily protein
MKTIICLCAAALVTIPAVAQPGAKSNAAIKTVHTVDDGSASRGANSFTERQAREHIAKSGYTDVSPLKKDKAGVWRGTARKDGVAVKVGLDFKAT